MKVFNLRCSAGHGFEGWFASETDAAQQSAQGLLTCPICGDADVARTPSAPRLNLGASGRSVSASPTQGGRVPEPGAASGGGTHRDGSSPAGDPLEAQWLAAVQQVLAKTEDVGERFPDEARRMHHGEIESRGIRGQASPEERQALREEGIEVHALPIPKGLLGPRH